MVLYKMVRKNELVVMFEQGFIRMNQDSHADWWKVGLRENYMEALEREQKIAQKEDRGPVNKETHFILKITFTALGVAYYTRLCKGVDYQFQPTLVKKPYKEDTDWKVWHFCDDLPMHATDANGNEYVTCTVMEIA